MKKYPLPGLARLKMYNLFNHSRGTLGIAAPIIFGPNLDRIAGCQRNPDSEDLEVLR